MYRWRRLTEEDRHEVLVQRMDQGHPIHSPKHIDAGERYYHITAACF